MIEDNKSSNKKEIFVASVRDSDLSFHHEQKISNVTLRSSAKEDIDSSNRNFLKNNKKEGNKDSCSDYSINDNNNDENNSSLSKSVETVIGVNNQLHLDTNEMRKVKKTIPEQNWFKNAGYIIIILNTIQLILRTYPEKFWVICNIFDYIFTILFIIEMSIKIAFFGFIKNSKSYLRRTPLNILDFLVTIGCTANIIINIVLNIKNAEGFPKIFEIKNNYANFSEFRLFTLLLFPLDHKTIFYNINFYLINIKKIFINLSNISVFIIFLYLFFSLIGLSLWRGRFSFFCHTQIEPINKNTFPLVHLFRNRLCGGNNKCNSRTDLCLSSKELYKKGLLVKIYMKKK